ncbi:MAG: hypothetical protein V1728_00460 [Candidatus Micrarchaeota archaeon]
MFENISRDDKMKYGAIALILLFIFSTIALYGRGGSGSNPTGTGGANISFQFSADGSLSLVQWDPVVVVTGTDPALPGLIEELKKNGTVSNDVTVAEGSILRLDDSKHVFGTAAAISALGLDVISDAYISITDLNTTYNGQRITVVGNTLKMQMPVIFDEGDSFPAQFTATVRDGKLVGISNLQMASAQEYDAMTTPDNVTLTDLFYRDDVPWESRNLNAAVLEVYMVGGSHVTYRPRSYIQFPNGLSDQQLSTLSTHMPAYVTNVATGLVGVSLDMTDKNRITQDMNALIGAEPSFPPSPLDIQPYRKENQSDADVAGMIRDSWMQAYPNLSMNLTPTYRIDVELPATIGEGNQTFLVANRSFVMNSLYAPSPDGVLELTFRPLGRRIDSFTYAQYLPAGTEAANQSGDPNLVWTAPADMGGNGTITLGNASVPNNTNTTGAQNPASPAPNASAEGNTTAYPDGTGAFYTPGNSS